MSLLQELQELDLTPILNARGSISLALDDDAIQGLLSGSAAQSVLGELGTNLADLRTTLDNPTALVEPLVTAITALPLGLDQLAIGPYLEAVREGAAILVRLLADFDGSPASLGRSLGASLGDLLDQAGAVLGDVVQVETGDLAQFRQLIAQVEAGTPTDPRSFAELALDILLPFPAARAELQALAPGVRDLLARIETISLPTTRTTQLVLALDAVAGAASDGDQPALQAALAELEAVRSSTSLALASDLDRATLLIDQLGLATVLAPLARLSGELRATGGSILDFLAELRADLAELRVGITAFNPNGLIVYLTELLDLLEARLRIHVVDAIEAQVERLKAWLRDLLSQLPLRQLRAELTSFIDGAAQAIREADLDRYAREVLQLLANLRQRVGGADLGAEIRTALETTGTRVGTALEQVTSALGTISTAVENLAAQAQALLTRLVEALRGFQATIATIAEAVEQLGIEAAGQQVVEALASLRQTAEELLSAAPLPEPMRGLVEQLIETLKGLDLSAAFAPIRNAAAELAIPAEVAGTIRAGLEQARLCLENLIPNQLIAAIEAEVSAALAEIRNFKPATLLSGVSTLINEAADFIEGLDPTPQIATIRAPFDAVLAGIDAAHPARLLAPAISAYNELFGAINIPPPATAARNVGQAVGAVGEATARAALTPVQQVAAPGALTVGGNTPSAAPREAISLDGARPGDIIRLLGYLPHKLREALAALDAGAAGAVLREIDSLIGGLAANLRRLPEALWELDTRLNQQLEAMLAPLGAAQLRTQIALRARASLSVGAAGAEFDLNGSLALVAGAGPGPMRAQIASPLARMRGQAQASHAHSGGPRGLSLEHVAGMLEATRLSGLVSDLDGLLAALDPEPIAAELDALVLAVVNQTPALFNAIEDQLRTLLERLKRIFEELNPVNQAAKFLSLLDLLREELDLLNPARLAAELAEVHAALRAAIAAYDPRHLAEAARAILVEIATELRGLDPAALLGDLTFLDDIVSRVEAALPFNSLQNVGAGLREVGAELATLDPAALLAAIDDLPERVVAQVERTIEAIRQELITLLESLDYFATSARAEASVSVG